MYERIVETTLEGVWLIDANSRTTFLNQSMATMLGYSRDELIGRSLFDLMDDEGRAIATANVERRKHGIAEAHEFVFRRKDGQPLWTRMTTNPLHDESGAYLGAVALVTDLTEAHLKEQERQRLWTILDQSLNEIYLFREHDLRFEYVNHGALTNLGSTLDEMRAWTPLDIKPHHTHESFRALVAPLVDGTRQKVVFETIHRRRDGSTYPVEVHLQLVPGADRLFVAIVNDATDRIQAQRELAASEARFRALIEHSLDLLVLADARGRFTFASPSVLPLLGYRPEEIVAFDPQDLVHPEDRERTFAALTALVAATHANVTEPIEFRVRHRDGSWRTLSANARNLLTNPSVGALVLNARDVTNEHRLEEQLQQAHRLESIGRLAGGVAHDFNNLLTTILASATFLEEEPSLSETSRDDVREIKRAGGRASELTNQLLAFARKRLIRPQSIALQQLLASQEKFLRRVIGEQVELTARVADDLWPIFADPSQLEQVIMNLAVNARDAMPDGGRLTIEARNIVLDDGFAGVHAEVKPGPYVQIIVSDTGEGIPAAVLPHIFEPFFTTKDVGAGTGLGLAMVYGIIRQSGGHVWVYSELGSGTTFKLYLPRAENASTIADAPPPTVTGGVERLLVVEDDEHVRRMLVRALKRGGYDVHAAETPLDGLAWARSQQGRFKMLITDVVMPGMSGKQLAAALAAEFPHIRTLYVSGYTENTIVHRGVLEDGVDFLAKPFSPTELLVHVREILDR
ncbi:MAG: PAS domain S-box protein [Kofleriaceae bacterium]